MSHRSSVRSFLGRALTVGCAVTALAAGPAWATCPVAEPDPAAGAGATAPAKVPAAAPAPSDSDLQVVRIDPDAAAPGGTTTVHAFIGNLGPDRTASPFTVVITLPEGVTPEGPFFPEDCSVFQNGHRVRCVFPAGLPKFRSATALIPVRLAADLPAPGTLTGGWVAVRSDDDRNEANNKQPFEIPVVQTARS
ncbi:hypothetical protein ABT263_30050 [Kitasatospora sp. NPDC001603]|uniref:hypothetical protein n=1 Tax=Kitasatospora sp. NPDC001603 TaxID=3154388 RepID=UPI00331A4730